MPASPMTFARRPQGVLSRIVPDRRRHKRISVTLLGRFMRENKEEHPCKLVDVSAGGAAVMSPVTVPLGERVVAYFDHIGGIEGKVARVFEGGFAFKINATKHKREKLAAQLTWLANRSELAVDGRRHDRITPNIGDSALQLSEGITLTCRVLDTGHCLESEHHLIRGGRHVRIACHSIVALLHHPSHGWTLWGAIQAKISAVDFDFHGYYTGRWERALEVLRSDRPQRWMDEAAQPSN